MAIRLYVVAYMAALLLIVTGGGAFGFSNGGGNSGSAPGQERAKENCNRVVNGQADKSYSNGNRAGGTSAPTNCDHYWSQ